MCYFFSVYHEEYIFLCLFSRKGNESVFLFWFAIQVNNFYINYTGEPFNERIMENKGLVLSMLCAYGVIVLILFNFFPFLSLLSYEPITDGLVQFFIVLMIFLDVLVCMLWKKYSEHGYIKLSKEIINKTL